MKLVDLAGFEPTTPSCTRQSALPNERKGPESVQDTIPKPNLFIFPRMFTLDILLGQILGLLDLDSLCPAWHWPAQSP